MKTRNLQLAETSWMVLLAVKEFQKFLYPYCTFGTILIVDAALLTLLNRFALLILQLFLLLNPVTDGLFLNGT